MKSTAEVAAKPQTKGEVCPHCGGAVFMSAQGKKCIGICGAFLGGQKVGVDHTAQRVPRTDPQPLGPSHAVTTSGNRLAR